MRRQSGGIPDPEPRGWSLGVGAMVMIFTAVAVAMTGVAVLMGASDSDWGDTMALVLLVSVVALVKVALANFVFFALMRADEKPDRRIPVENPPPDPPGDRERRQLVRIRTAARARRVLRAADSVPAAATLVAAAEPAHRRIIPVPRRPA